MTAVKENRFEKSISFDLVYSPCGRENQIWDF